jgi:phage shock protein PspC (stress-responsive transcriptional regulator)
MFQMYKKQTKNSALGTLRGLALQFGVLSATLALLGVLYLMILFGG